MPRRILYLNPSAHLGGAERSLVSLLEALDRNQYQPLAALGHPGLLQNELQRLKVPCEVWPFPDAVLRYSRFHRNSIRARAQAGWQLPGFLLRTRALARKLRPLHLLHANGIKSHLQAAWLSATLAPRPLLLWHAHDFPPAGEAGWLLAAAARRADLVIANSQAVAQAWLARIPSLAGRVEVVHNGINLRIFAGGNGPAFRARHRLWPQAPLVGMVGILAPWKGQEIFLQAARRVLDARPEVRFLLVGDDVYDTSGHGGRRQMLESLAADLGLGEAIRFTGFLDAEMADAYAALDLAVHASTRPEPFGMVIIEAMAAGAPVVAAAAGGVLEIIRPGENGWLTPPGDAAGLAQAILKLLADDNLRMRLSRQARADASRNFSMDVYAAKMQSIYDKLVSGIQA